MIVIVIQKEGASIKAERERERKELVWTRRGGKWGSSCQTILTMGYGDIWDSTKGYPGEGHGNELEETLKEFAVISKMTDNGDYSRAGELMALQTLAWKLRAAIVTDADEHGKALKEYSMLTMINDCKNGVFSRASELQAFQAVIDKTDQKREAIVAAQAPKPKKSRVQRVKKGIYPEEGYPEEVHGRKKAKPLEKMKMRKRTVEKMRMRKNEGDLKRAHRKRQ